MKGGYAEQSLKHLEKEGYRIIGKNFRSQFGEIDIIAKENDYLVFIEVKYRSSIKSGYPHEAINYNKRNRIAKTAQFYMLKNNIDFQTPCRFDVVAIINKDLNIIKNAFEFDS